MPTKVKEESLFAYVLFLIWPFFASLLSFKEYKKGWAKNMVWLFVIFYGFTFVILDEGMDSNVYRENFLIYTLNDYSLSEFISTLYSESSKVDILQDLLSYLVSKVTDNYHILFALYGLVFGFFYSRNIWYLLSRALPHLKDINIIIITCFVFVVGFWQINGFRFWTATHIFVFGMLPFLFENKKKYILVSALSVFVHFSFVVPLAIVLAYYFIGNRLTIFFYFFVVTFFLNEIDISLIRDNLFYLPDLFYDRTYSYLNEDYKIIRVEQRSTYNWYALYYRKFFNWVLFLLSIIIFYSGRKIMKQNYGLLQLFSFALLFFGLANILSSIPSGGRFVSIAQLLLVASVFLYIQLETNLKAVRSAVLFSTPVILLFIAVSLRIAFETISLTAVAGNPLISLFGENDLSLINLIK
ncbi:MAG: EpsG family protein [Flavobacteriaceae bacterium]|nr:EpsG family protein [Flavobacteriaceae bacterium]